MIKINDIHSGEWQQHPRFSQIQFKPLLTSKDNSFANVNTVLIPPDGEIGFHGHVNQIETIFIFRGRSILTTEGVDHSFGFGQIVAVPIGVEHSLRKVGKEDVQLLTFFTPPL